MFSMGSKTPVSCLQEYLVSKELLPHYELTHNGTGTHNPEFVFRVQVGSLFEVGKGRSKQEAKHRAAEKMLKSLKVIDPEKKEEKGRKESPSLLVEEELDNQNNYVGQLKEYCIVNLYPEAKYHLGETAGPPHNRIFKMICTVSQLQDSGISKTKKQAKQIAACCMLKRLKELGKNSNIQHVDSTGDENSSLKHFIKVPTQTLTDEEVNAKYNLNKSLSNPSTKEPAVLYKDHFRVYEILTESSPMLVDILKKTTLVTYDSASDLLNQICKELEVTLTCSELPKKGNSKVFFISLSVNPPIAATGSDEKNATFNLLNSLVSLCQ